MGDLSEALRGHFGSRRARQARSTILLIPPLLNLMNDGQQWMDGIEGDIEKSQQGRVRGMPTLSQLKAATAKLGLLESDAEGMYDAWLTNGFTVKGGAKIKDWQAAVRNWHRNGWFNSQRRARHVPAPKDRDAELINQFKRYAQKDEQRNRRNSNSAGSA
jgi:hypothetical protein